jgi:hypothetical protein
VGEVKFKPTHRQQMQANLATHQLYAAASGKPIPDYIVDSVKQKQERAAPGSDGRELESSVIKAVGHLLCVHPQVLIALRMNSGMATNDNGAPVWFMRWLRMPEPMRMSDFAGWLRDGNDVFGVRKQIPFAIECKRPGWSKPTDKREREQAAYLSFIRACGGRAGFATSVEQAQNILEGK